MSQLPSLLETPEVRPLLPMIYLAWADGELSDDELGAVRQVVDEQPWLSLEARAAVRAWLEPDRPPSPSALRQLLKFLREAAGTMDSDARRSMSSLGVALADQSDDENIQRALGRIEEALGVCRADAALGLPGQASVSQAESNLDPNAMQAWLDGQRAAAREPVRAFLSDPEHRLSFDATKEEQREHVLALLKELAKRGFGNLAYPGVTTDDKDLGTFMAAFETLGYGPLSLLVKYGVQFGLFGGSIFFLGTEKHHRLLTQIASVELPGCFAMTELGHGSNVMALQTTATYDADTDEFVVHTPSESARKEWIGNAAAHGTMATVFAQLLVGGESHGVHALLVPIRSDDGEPLPGVRIGDCGHKLGLNGVDNGRLWFNQVRIPRDNLLDRYGRVDDEGRYQSDIPSPNKRFFTMLGTLVGGRVCVAAGAVSASKVGLTIAIRYGASRRQFGASGQPETRLLNYPAHRRRLLPALAQSYALTATLEHVRDEFLERGDDTRELEALAAGVKAYATDHATWSLQQAREACGGQGYLSANRIGPLKSDSDVFTTFEGDNTVLLQLVGKSLLTDFKRQFADSQMLGTLRFLGAKAKRAIAQANPITSRMRDEEHLRSEELLKGLFEFREKHLVEQAALRIKKRVDDGMGSFEAFVSIQNHVLAMARAHVERVVHDKFRASIAQAPEELRETLDRLCDLWALWRVECDLGWFMENGTIEPSKAKAIRDLVDQLCDEVAPDALSLVAAFGIPEPCLAAPIAFGDPAER